MLNKLIVILLVTFCGVLNAQDIPIGNWQDHLPYTDAVSVAYGNGMIYCATGSAVFIYDENDKVIDKLNLVNGLSDIGLSKIKYSEFNGSVIIGYTNGNIDIIDQNKSITNLSFIKSSSIVGIKSINHIFCQGKLAYLSTGFGIVVLDLEKVEILETYFFGPLGNVIFTNSVAIDDQNIYAATNEGVYFADKNSANLADYNSWSLLSDLGSAKYSNIVSYSNRLFVSLDSSIWDGDTLYFNDAGVWQKFLPNGTNIENINLSENTMIVSYFSSVEKYDTSLTNTVKISRYNGLFNLRPKEVVLDDDDFLLIAEESHGVVRMNGNSNGEIITLNGPSSSNSFSMDFFNDELWVVAGGFGVGLSKNLVNHASNGAWADLGTTIINNEKEVAKDMVFVSINPKNSSNVFVSSWSSGLFEYNNNEITNIYTAQNSGIDSVINSSKGISSVGRALFDSEDNLWVTSSFSSENLAVKTVAGDWFSFSFSGTAQGDEYHSMLIDKNDYKWIANTFRGEIIIFDDNNTPSDKSDDQFVINSDIPGTAIFSVVEDLDGEIWLGTNEGISVFYNPSQVFEQDITAEQIFVQQDGQTQILLETEVVTTIAIDGANRKWIGTQTSGVFLMSEDGTEQIEHFTTSNSPLFSNTIFDIVIDPKTGEVFFGTEKGLISYKGTATEAVDEFKNVFVYPNPVKPDFNGTIAIRGLVKDTDVRITDISGNIVYKTTSFGGQAVWDGRDFNGNKVQTGVYMIFNGSPEGQQKAAAKILIYH